MNIYIRKIVSFGITALVLFVPLLSFAAISTSGTFSGCSAKPSDFRCLVASLLHIVNRLIPFLFLVALVFFFWGLAKFILLTGSGNAKAISSGKQLMIWGIISLFVISSLWGIISFLTDSFGFHYGIPLLPIPA